MTIEKPTDNQTTTQNSIIVKPKNSPKKTSLPAKMSQMLWSISKQLLTPKTYTKQNLTTQWQRSKRVARLMMTVQTGMGYAWQIQQHPNADKHEVIRHIQSFCTQSLQALNIEVIAVKPIPTHHALWTSNHISWLDIPVVGSSIPTFFLSKEEIAHWPIIGWLARMANTLFIKRGSGDANAVANQMTAFLKDGFPVVFFPEATTTDGTAVKRIHGKLLQSAMDSGVLIQPIVICYVNKYGQLDQYIPYYGDINFLDSVRDVLDNEPAKAYILPLEAIDPMGKTRSEITALLQERMQQGLIALHQQVMRK
ncbi:MULTISPECIES: lysophospholipid acyltransferase family protein [unclassified Moraxella]|uniref:lysophospholipid acyltransferase family protein n=1 Tax=unclassified Moraxella TaxID=2685852 RepID=UPI003AF6AF78